MLFNSTLKVMDCILQVRGLGYRRRLFENSDVNHGHVFDAAGLVGGNRGIQRKDMFYRLYNILRSPVSEPTCFIPLELFL